MSERPDWWPIAPLIADEDELYSSCAVRYLIGQAVTTGAKAILDEFDRRWEAWRAEEKRRGTWSPSSAGHALAIIRDLKREAGQCVA